MTTKPAIQIIGDAAILSRPKVALFCSVKCPGKPLYTFDHPANLELMGAGAKSVTDIRVRR
ncbi:MAG: hypothetical protein HQ559_13965 [Lentisphaerae bacterium]|nr:hypothetical protein [Lentisphaerota bacterium]